MEDTPWDVLEQDLDLARSWYEDQIKHEERPERQKQLRYSLANKLSADWQKFLKAVAARDGLSNTAKGKIGNGTVGGIDSAYTNYPPNPLVGIENYYSFFGPFNTLRNNVDHGDEPPPPSLGELELWMESFRAIGNIYGRSAD